MATADLNPILSSISGTVGRIVFYKRHGKTIMRQWVKPANPRTPAQQSNRERFARAMSSWQSLSAEEKHAYNARAGKLGMTGHNLYIREYMSVNKGMKSSCSFTFSPLRREGREERSNTFPVALSKPSFHINRACPSVTAPSSRDYDLVSPPLLRGEGAGG